MREVMMAVMMTHRNHGACHYDTYQLDDWQTVMIETCCYNTDATIIMQAGLQRLLMQAARVHPLRIDHRMERKVG